MNVLRTRHLLRYELVSIWMFYRIDVFCPQPPTPHSPDTFTIFIQARGDWSRRIFSLYHQNIKCISRIPYPINNLKPLHTATTHTKQENDTSSLRPSNHILSSSLSLPSHHQHPASPFTSIPQHLIVSSSPSLSTCDMTEKSLSYSMPSSNISRSNPSDKVSRVNSLDLHTKPISHVSENQSLGSWHPHIIPSSLSSHTSQEVKDNVVSDASEPKEQGIGSSKPSHFHPIYHSSNVESYEPISRSVNPLEYARGDQSLKTCNPVPKNNSVNISSLLHYKHHFPRRKSKKEERKSTTTDRKTIIHLSNAR